MIFVRYFLVDFSFRVGEYEQPFHHVFESRNTKTLERKIHHYLKTYYPEESERDGNIYFYFGGEVAVEYEGWEEIKSADELLRRLKV